MIHYIYFMASALPPKFNVCDITHPCGKICETTMCLHAFIIHNLFNKEGFVKLYQMSFIIVKIILLYIRKFKTFAKLLMFLA